MSLFTSNREKRLWILAFVVVVTIYSTVGLVWKIAATLHNYDLLAVFFVTGMLLVGATIVTQGLTVRPGGTEIVITLGLIATFFMAATRITLLEERSHLIEYSIVAVFIYEALKERKSHGAYVPNPGLIAIIATSIIGIIDEAIQAFLPSRVFDPQDISFNIFAAIFAIIASLILSWFRKWIRKRKEAK
jgi:VanZ family protein